MNGTEYTTPYYLADGIYPKWPTLIQSIREPRSAKDRHFARLQEAYRKDVERAFGVLQARFAIITRPARTWSRNHLSLIMRACIVMHNMVVEYNDATGLADPLEPSPEVGEQEVEQEVEHEEQEVEQVPSWDVFVRNYAFLHSQTDHAQLKQDLVDHLWARKGIE